LAERLHWLASFWISAAWHPVRVAFVAIFLEYAGALRANSAGKPAQFATFLGLLRIPSLRVVTTFVAVATFGLFLSIPATDVPCLTSSILVLARAGFEASVYPQVGTAFGLITGAAIAIVLQTDPACPVLVVTVALFCGAPCLVLTGASPTLETTRLAAIGFRIFAGSSRQSGGGCFRRRAGVIAASTVASLNFLGATVSGFAPSGRPGAADHRVEQ